MFSYKCVFTLGLILTLFLQPIFGKTTYPKSSGLSGGGRSSSGLSGAGHHSNSSRGNASRQLPSKVHSYPSTVRTPYPTFTSTQSYSIFGGKPGYSKPGKSSSYPLAGGKSPAVSSSASIGKQSYPSYGASRGSQSTGNHVSSTVGSQNVSKHSYPPSGANQGYPPPNGYVYPSSTQNIPKHTYPPSGVNSLTGSYVYPPPAGNQNISKHSYPPSGANVGSSPTGSYVYPSPIGKLNISRQNYPPPGINQGSPNTGTLNTSRHTYPSPGVSQGSTSTGSQGYPPSIGSQGYPSSSGHHTYPSTGRPAVNTHVYPNSGGRLSGGGHGHPPKNSGGHHTTNLYHNYHYKPPAQIIYIPNHGSSPVKYPVYHGSPPNYVFQYKHSRSKYSTLLAGLALMNLGNLRGTGHAAHQSRHDHGLNVYRSQPGEVCKFAIKKENGVYEETKIDCQIISSFILEDMKAQKFVNSPYTMLPNGTLLSVDNGALPIPLTSASQTPGYIQYDMLSNGTLVPKVILPDISSALDVKGKPVEVTPRTECFVMNQSPTWNMRKSIPCRLLQTYANTSLHKNSVARIMPMFTAIAVTLAYVIAY